MNKADEQYAELLERSLLLEEQKNNACLARDKYRYRLQQVCGHEVGGVWTDTGLLKCRRCDKVLAESSPVE